jgi:hypothetical protein
MTTTQLLPGPMSPTSVLPDERPPRYSYPDSYFDTSDPAAFILREPHRPVIEVTSADSVILDHTRMEPGRPYAYRLGGEWLTAVRRDDGSIDFYAVPRGR